VLPRYVGILPGADAKSWKLGVEPKLLAGLRLHGSVHLRKPCAMRRKLSSAETTQPEKTRKFGALL
jgi:hypothetical protein